MRKIEARIAQHMRTFASYHETIYADEVRAAWGKDSVTLYNSGLIVYRYRGNTVARYTPHKKTMELGREDWRTATTKSRINAIADAFGLPRVYQKDYIWTWSDGEKYTGARTFLLDK